MSYNKQLCYNDLTQNHEGAKAWRMSPEWELYTTVVTTMGVEDKFYESGQDRVKRIASLVRKVDAEFVAQLAIYAREEMQLRSVPLLLLVELAKCHRGDSLVSRAVSRTVQRADEITELLMCYQWRSSKKDLSGLSNQLRKGLAEAFCHFDEYQFAKYDRRNRKVTLRDALLLVHPKPKDAAQAELFRKILNGTLDTPYTWETELSATGKQKFSSAAERDEALCEKWQQLIRSGRLGYMAMMRNLVNMTNLCIDDESKEMVCRRLSDPEAVRKSRQLPFRFLSAYLELTYDRIPNPWFLRASRNYWEDNAGKALSDRYYEIERQMTIIRNGYHHRHASKVCRYPVRTALAYNANYKGTPIGIFPKRHIRRRIKQRLHKEGLSRKDMLKLQKLEKQLENIRKRQSALRTYISKRPMRYDGAYWQRNEIGFQKLVKSRRAEWARRDKRLASRKLTKTEFVTPLLEALEEAVRSTADNIRGFDKNTRVLLASDTSGSMFRPVSQQSAVIYYHIGLLLSMLMKFRCENVVTGMFGDFWETYDFPSDDILYNTLEMISHEGEVGYSTNGHAVIDWLIDERLVMDKVMLFTDCELWDSTNGGSHLSRSWSIYKRIAPDAKLYLFDLAGYGTSPVSMKRKDVFNIAGWSDKVFDILYALENGENAIDMIRRIVV